MKKTTYMGQSFLVAFLVFAGLTLISLPASSQCDKKNYCDDYEGDYDYRSQSSFAKLSPGDTSSLNCVLYGGQRYRIYVCSDPKLGDVTYKIVNPERKTKRTIVSIKRDTVVTYKSDDDGNFLTDDNGELIVASKAVSIDTTWATERYTVDKVMYDKKKNTDKPYFEIAPKKSERFIVRVTVPGGDPNYGGCVNIYVGRKPIDAKGFSKTGQGRITQDY
jgi:hypothetical protein